MLADIAVLLRRTLISYHGRDAYAASAGGAWIEQLQQVMPQHGFSDEQLQLLTRDRYKPDYACDIENLLQSCERWLRALPRSEPRVQLEWPQVLLVIPLPLLVYLALSARPMQQQAALRVPVIDDFRLGATQADEMKPHRWRQWLSLLAWLLMVLAASRPQWLGESIAIPVSGRDLMLAVDLSDSMRTGDFKIGISRSIACGLPNRWRANLSNSAAVIASV